MEISKVGVKPVNSTFINKNDKPIKSQNETDFKNKNCKKIAFALAGLAVLGTATVIFAKNRTNAAKEIVNRTRETEVGKSIKDLMKEINEIHKNMNDNITGMERAIRCPQGRPMLDSQGGINNWTNFCVQSCK